jgi:hypothetical protein
MFQHRRGPSGTDLIGQVIPMDKNTTTLNAYTTTGWSRAQELRAEAAALREKAEAVERAALAALATDGCPTWCTAAVSEDGRVRNSHRWSIVTGGAARIHHGTLGTWVVDQVDTVDLVDGSGSAGRVERIRRSPAAAA